MKELWNKNKKYIITGIVIVGLAILIYWWFNRSVVVEQAEVPTDMPGTKLNEEQKKDVRDMSGRLKTALDSTFNVPDDEIKAYVSMSDTLFVSVYNDFNKNYAKDFKGGLRLAIDEAWSIDSDIKAIIDSKFNRLNLK